MAVRSVKKVPPRQTAPQEPQPERSGRSLEERIREAAYYRAQQRGFSPGYEEQDWFAAEAEIKRGPGPDA
jgi:hypothetical protein